MRSSRWSDAVLVVGLVLAVQMLYRNSHGAIQLADSHYTLFLAESWLETDSLSLEAVVPVDPVRRRAMPGYRPEIDRPYHTTIRVGRSGESRIFYGYPHGSVVLSVPVMAVQIAVGRKHTRRPDGSPDVGCEGRLQQRIAASLSAILVGMFYLVARYFGPRWVSVGIALGFAVGSPVWSTLSRAMWSHTWLAVWLTAAILTLLVARKRRLGEGNASGNSDAISGAILGTCLFWVLFSRPQGGVSVLGIGVYLLWFDRRLLGMAVGTGAMWLVGLAAFSQVYFESWMPPTFAGEEAGTRLDWNNAFSRIDALLLSPSRGLLVFCPYLAVVAGMLAGFRHAIRDWDLVGLAVAVVLGQGAVFAGYDGWHGGASFGPRHFCDVFPWFVILTAIAIRAMREAPVGRRRKVLAMGLLVVTVGWSGWVHWRGANEVSAWDWNYLAGQMSEADAARDWRYPQFLAGVTFEVSPDGRVQFRK